MCGRATFRCLAIAALWVGGFGAAPAEEPVEKPAIEKRALKEVEQISPADGGDRLRVEELAPRTGFGTSVEQATGIDLCDPSVSPEKRRAAGVDCESRLEPTVEERGRGLAQDPLLEPRQEDLKKDFKQLDLGDDVPATVILQK